MSYTRFTPLYSHYRSVLPDRAFLVMICGGLLVVASDDGVTFLDVIGTPKNWLGVTSNPSELELTYRPNSGDT